MRFPQFFLPAILDLPIIIFTLVAAHGIINRVVKKHGLGAQKSLLIKLYYYHLLFCLIYVAYIFLFGGDAIGYWRPPVRFIREGASLFLLHEPGSSFIHFIVYPFSQILKLSLWGGTILFSLFGFGGFLCIYLTIRRNLKVNPTLFGYKLFPLVLFLPNMHFWSSGVGKDTIIFFALALFIYALTNVRQNIVGLVLSFYLAFFIRPHIALVMLIGAGMAVLLSSRGISTFMRLGLIAASIVIFVLISGSVFNFIGVEEDSVESYEDIANLRSKNLSRQSVGSSIELSTYSVPFRIFTFLYRPLFIDSGNALGLVVSFENLLYLMLTFAILKFKTLNELWVMPMVLKACFFIALATSYFLSSSLSNLGIIIRQKNMVMFMLLLVTLYVISQFQYRQQKMKQRPRNVVVPQIPGASIVNTPGQNS
ncbi:MAG: hypothetical protein WKF87_11870 [Chryseolinea sp.]